MRELILRLARENSGCGYLRIVGELRKLEIDGSSRLAAASNTRSAIVSCGRLA